MNLCVPAMLYLIIYIIIEIFKGFSVQFQIGAFVLNLIIMLVWVYLLNYLCLFIMIHNYPPTGKK